MFDEESDESFVSALRAWFAVSLRKTWISC
jgi:hypothetical protein